MLDTLPTVAVAGTSLGLALLCSLPTARLLYKSRRSITGPIALVDPYQDADGTATQESEAAYSDKVPKYVLYVAGVVGAATSIAAATYSTAYAAKIPSQRPLYVADWIITGTWALILLQIAYLVLEKSSVRRYQSALGTSATALAAAVFVGIQQWPILERRIYHPTEFRTILKPYLALGLTQFALAICVTISGLALPRRPAVFVHGRPVDGQWTVSVLGLTSFGWFNKLLSRARKEKLDLEDIPVPPYNKRAAYLQDAFNPRNRQGSILKILLFRHWLTFILQISTVMISSIVGFAPQLAMYKLLRELEERGIKGSIDPIAWVWAALLGVSLVLEAYLDSWTVWISVSQISIPVKGALSAMVFSKTIRRKDIKASTGDEDEDKDDKDDESAGNNSKGEDAEHIAQKQAIVNLISVDTQRIADFASLFRYIPYVIFSGAISVFFIVSLIGWIPLVSGFGAFLILLPCTIYLAEGERKAENELMKLRDKKLAVVSEALQGIRQIKFAALENQWESKILKARARELVQLWVIFLYEAASGLCWDISPVLLTSVSIAVFAFETGGLSPSVAFTVIGVFQSLQMTVNVMPWLVREGIEALVSIRRIEKFLAGDEKEDILLDGNTISFNNASISWPVDSSSNKDEQAFVLRGLNLQFPSNELSVISGKTGSGKSLLLSAILGEHELLQGSITVPRYTPHADRFDDQATPANWTVPNAIAYVAQIPWIENASIKDNILFGLPFYQARYDQTVKACALEKDFEMLEDGDRTEIGATGINLSGGQRWRVTLARALYSRASILVMDDIFSAVDAHVGRWLLDNALCGELGKGRTRILATHHAALVLAQTAYTVHLADGKVEHAGLTTNLQQDGTLQDLLDEEPSKEIPVDDAEMDLTLKKSATNKSKSAEARKFVEDEHREEGRVKFAVWLGYLNGSGGIFLWLVPIILFFGVELGDISEALWLTYWTRSYGEESKTHLMTLPTPHQPSQRHLFSPSLKSAEVGRHSTLFYVLIYFGINLAKMVLNVTGSFAVFYRGIAGSRRLFQEMCATVLRMPLRWIDTVPTGRILNRFTADVAMVDGELPQMIPYTVSCFLQICGTIGATVFVSPSVLGYGFILIAVAVYYASYYLPLARAVKRLNSTTKSPVLDQLGSVVLGVATIRAFDKTPNYASLVFKKIDENLSTLSYLYLTTRWLSFRLSILGAAFAGAVSFLVVGIPSIDAALAGFALSFALNFSSDISYALRFYTQAELNMSAAERILEYMSLEPESTDGKAVPASWPTEGRLEVQDLVVGYAPDLPAVLKGLSFKVEAGERVGIVGRTGAGKSSLALALFRLLQARSGSICIDGLDISHLKLSDIRSRLAIIPQDPTIFSGTVRSNLDTFDQATDLELKAALQRVHLIRFLDSDNSSGNATPAEGSSSGTATPNSDTNKNIFEDLSSPISDNGLNLSQGQRQLLCLARAIVQRAKIMVLDEATSAVDMETDTLIQRSIREDFHGSTLLVIAHRLSTIADFDKVMVMGDGRAEEFGTPKELLAKKGLFYEMVQQSGEKDLLHEMIQKQ